MTDEIESAFGYRQFTKACDLLEDLVAKIQSALQSAQVIDWRVPEIQLELARAYEALSRDEEAEATFAAAAASAKRINGCPTSEEFVQFALGEFYLRRRKYDRALQASQFVRSGEPSADAWLLLNIRVQAYVGLGLAAQANETALAYISAAPSRDDAQLQMETILGHAAKKA